MIALGEQEQAQVRRWLLEPHQDIMQNFTPRVVTFRKKHKAIIAPGAFDGLIEPDDDDAA